MASRNTLLDERSPSSPIDKEKPQSDHVEMEDQANKPATDHTGTRGKTNQDEIRLVRSIDWKMMPILWLMYCLNYLDRNAITVARLDSLEEDLNLTSTQYQSCVSILFVGYILGQIPSSKFRSSFLHPRRPCPRSDPRIYSPWLIIHPSSGRHATYTSSTLPIYVRSHVSLGSCQRSYRRHT